MLSFHTIYWESSNNLQSGYHSSYLKYRDIISRANLEKVFEFERQSEGLTREFRNLPAVSGHTEGTLEYNQLKVRLDLEESILLSEKYKHLLESVESALLLEGNNKDLSAQRKKTIREELVSKFEQINTTQEQNKLLLEQVSKDIDSSIELVNAKPPISPAESAKEKPSSSDQSEEGKKDSPIDFVVGKMETEMPSYTDPEDS